MQVFRPRAVQANKTLATEWISNHFPALEISSKLSEPAGLVRVSASTDPGGYMLYNPKKEIYLTRIKENLLPPWMEESHWLRGFIIVRDMRSTEDEPGRCTAYFLPRAQWLPLIQSLNQRAGAKWALVAEFATAQMQGETDLNGTWLGWVSGVSAFESALIESGCLERADHPALSDEQILDHIGSIDEDTALTEIEKMSARKERIGHTQWAADVKSRAGYRCQLLPTLQRNLVAGHIKPWSVCNEGEHLDRANGICLSPNLDKLFEDGLIGISDEGRLLINGLSEEELQIYGLTKPLSISLVEGQQAYLQWHRENVLRPAESDSLDS